CKKTVIVCASRVVKRSRAPWVSFKSSRQACQFASGTDVITAHKQLWARSMTPPSPVIQFWKAAGPEMWFAKNTDFDTAFRAGFLESHMAAARRELDGWSDTAEGSLALLLLLDQFPRNAFRDT